MLDVTDAARREEAERAAARSEEQRRTLERSKKERDEFLTMVAHELRTPLTTIIGWSHLAMTDPETDSRMALEHIDASATELARLVEDILSVAELGRTSFELSPALVDPRKLVGDVVEDLRPIAATRGVHVRFVSEGSISQLRADPTRLRQITRNLVWNAIKFSTSGDEVVISLADTAGSFQLMVEDRGQGIPRSLLEDVFKPYQRATAERGGGLGLGLAIAQLLAQAHGGKIEAKSEGPRRGATFVVTLPHTAS